MGRGEIYGKFWRTITGAAPRPQTDSESACGVLRHQLGHHFKRGTPKPATIKKLAAVLKVPYENLMAAAGHIQAFPEEIREASESYQSVYEIYQTAVTRGAEHLPIFNSQKWEHLSKQDIENLSKYFDFLSSEAKKRASPS